MKNGTYVVKSWAQMKVEFGLTKDGNCKVSRVWTKPMEKECLIHRHIEVKNNQWKHYNISDEMLLGPAFAIGAPVEVRDKNGEEWEEDLFEGYRFSVSTIHPVQTLTTVWRQVRAPQEPTIEITVKVNGTEKKLSDISEETLLKIREEVK